MNGYAKNGMGRTFEFAEKTTLAVFKIVDVSLLILFVESENIHGAMIETDLAAITKFWIYFSYAHFTSPRETDRIPRL